MELERSEAEPEPTEHLPALTEAEADELERLESTINRAIKKAGAIAGDALREIRDRRLYRSSHRSFEAYVLDRCGFSRATAYRMIAVAEAKALPPPVSRADTDLPGTTRASRRARPDPEPSQREAVRRQQERRADVPSPAPLPVPVPSQRAAQPGPHEMTSDGMMVCPRCNGHGLVDVPSRSDREEVKPSDCPHPPGRRIGDQCAACGATVKGKR